MRGVLKIFFVFKDIYKYDIDNGVIYISKMGLQILSCPNIKKWNPSKQGDGIPLDMEIIAKVSHTSVWDKIATGWRRSKFGVIGSLVFIAYFRSEANGSCLYGDA